MPPGVYSPVAVAIIDGFHRSAVGISKVCMEICRASQRFERNRVVSILPIKRYLRKGDVVISGGWSVVAVFTPISVRRLLFGGEAAQNLHAKIFPSLVPKHATRKEDKSGPRSIVVRRGSNVRCVVPGRVLSLHCIRDEGYNVLFNVLPPTRTALFPQFHGEQPIR